MTKTKKIREYVLDAPEMSMIEVAKLIEHWEDRSMRDEDTPQSHTAKALRLLVAECMAWRNYDKRDQSEDSWDRVHLAVNATNAALALPEPHP